MNDGEVGHEFDDDPVVEESVVVESVETADVLVNVIESVLVDEEDSLVEVSWVELVYSVVESGTDAVEPVDIIEVVDVGPVPIVAGLRN